MVFKSFISFLLLVGSVLAGDAVRVPAQPIGGTLFMHGGGALKPPVMGAFLELCDRPAARVVVIPTAAAVEKIDRVGIVALWAGRGFSKVTVLHAPSREEAQRENFSQPLREAAVVWISGGDIERLRGVYFGTPVERELRALVGRGGVVGGTGAGAEVMGVGFGLIQGAVIEPRFDASRADDVRASLREHPGSVGYGISKGAALILKERALSAIGDGGVTVCLAASESRRERFQEYSGPRKGDHIALSRAAIARAENLEFKAVPPVVENGTVVAFGGGATTKGGLQHFVRAAGGSNARIVVIPTAGISKMRVTKNFRRLWESVGANNIKQLHAETRAEADSDAFVAQIDAAGGVWFTGGRQWKLVDRYSGTRAEAAIRRVLERGGAVGGTSAGATILGDYLVRGDPLTSVTMMQEGYEKGLVLVPGVAIDQHFAQRNRFDDMAALKRAYPQLVGIGIDEGMALAFEGGGCRAFGRGKVHIYPVGGERVELKHGGRYRLVP